MSTTYYICSIFSGSKKKYYNFIVQFVLYITRVRVLYERVLKTKIDFEITTFLNYEWELREQEMQNQIKTRKITFLFLFHVLNSTALEVHNSKKQ